ncbi:glycerol-3-phosphate 1-O-acyltransferase PlsY [Pontibacter sp. JAM-7]|uniref:glycerol-3-phosphate 1-O-acyltransferase PlsY n=1 Tax=Pontibacter sp. JAM-7 TaxID=3366581 RepID=UPI003AF53DFC
MSEPLANSTMLVLGLTLLAYLWGSIPTAVLVCHALNLPDPRSLGSRNPGASNVLRIGNRQAAALTLFGDLGKGVLALLPAILLELSPLARSACALAAICGHLFPLFSSFRGGKGVATTLGACLGLYWPLALLQTVIWVAIVSYSRRASLGSISIALLSPLLAWLIAPDYLLTLWLISFILLWCHWQNIRNLLTGTEPRF